MTRWNSLMVWEGGTPPTFTLPVTFIALNNPFIEVSGAIAALTAMISPEPRQPGGCKLKTAPVRPVVAARPAE
ncbi:hypothetical protein ACJEDY_24985, partial [Escherichia coli]